MIDLSQPIDLENPEAFTFLRNIQGNIIKGHGRDHTAHFILKITGEVITARQWMADFAERYITSAEFSRRMTVSWKADTSSVGEPFFMILLSSEGYRKLGFTEDELPIPGGDDRFIQPDHHKYFKSGMKVQEGNPRTFNDPPVSEWEAPYQESIHAMVLLADDSRERLEHSIAEITDSVKNIFEILTIERGDVLRRVFPRGEIVVEHFGFQDGVSQPLMIKQDIDKEVAERGSSHWNPAAPLSLALVKEPGTQGGYGSFMVFRKLEQNVRAFWQSLEELSSKSGIPINEAGALAVGRFEDGIPIVPTTVIKQGVDPNDFHYDQDPEAAKCPFHAHIRKTNPRGDVPRILGAPAEFERARRVIRRGITYGNRPDMNIGTTAERPDKGVGLLFMCFQSNLDQFAIQQEGSDLNDFVKECVGVDAVIGQNLNPVAQTWQGNVKHTMANFVKMLGGEYFFAPSISFLISLHLEG